MDVMRNFVITHHLVIMKDGRDRHQLLHADAQRVADDGRDRHQVPGDEVRED